MPFRGFSGFIFMFSVIVTPKWNQKVKNVKVSGLSMKKSRSPCERAPKNRALPSLDSFREQLLMGERSVQRGPGHTEWRTPRFSNVAPQGRIGRRVLRTILAVPSPNDFWNVLSMGEKSVQRGRGPQSGGPPGFPMLAPRGDSEGECFAPW